MRMDLLVEREIGGRDISNISTDIYEVKITDMPEGMKDTVESLLFLGYTPYITVHKNLEETLLFFAESAKIDGIPQPDLNTIAFAYSCQLQPKQGCEEEEDEATIVVGQSRIRCSSSGKSIVINYSGIIADHNSIEEVGIEMALNKGRVANLLYLGPNMVGSRRLRRRWLQVATDFMAEYCNNYSRIRWVAADRIKLPPISMVCNRVANIYCLNLPHDVEIRLYTDQP